MDGRRVERRAPRRNPLATLFAVLCVAVIALAILAAVLGMKLRAANKELSIAEMKLEQYEAEKEKEEKPEREEPDLGRVPGDDVVATEPGTQEPAGEPENTPQSTVTERKVGWLDLTGHNEVQVAPQSVLDQYTTCYATDGVNLRGGPGTNYDRVKLLAFGTQLKAAARDGDWVFVNADGKFGWVNGKYLSPTKPEAKKTETPQEQKPAEQPPAEQPPAEQKPEEVIASPGQINP